MSIESEKDQARPELPVPPTSEPENITIQNDTAPPPYKGAFKLPSDNHSPLLENIDQAPVKPASLLDNQPLVAGEGYENPISFPDSSLESEADLGPTEEEEPSLSGWQIAKAVIREIVETVVLTLIIFFLIQSVIRNFRVDGHSMDPNLQHGQYLVVDKISYKLPFDLRSPQRGDIIVFEPPTHPDKDFVKRIIGLPGETIEIRQGQVFINNEPLNEPFGARLDRFSMPARAIPAEEYFVMGDNRANSNDSRNWGSLQTDRVIGRAWLSYWPPQTWGTIPNDRSTGSATLFYLFNPAND